MTTSELEVRRKVTLPGIGTKAVSKTVQVPQAENFEDVLNLFDGTIEQKQAAVVEAVNKLKESEIRSETVASFGLRTVTKGKKNPIALVRDAIKNLQKVDPSMDPQEIGKQVLTMGFVRESLEEAGFSFDEAREGDDDEEINVEDDETSGK